MGISRTCVKNTTSLSFVMQCSHEHTSIGITLNVFIILFHAFFQFIFHLDFYLGILCLSYFLLHCVLYILIY
jgi:hypothetical protein